VGKLSCTQLRDCVTKRMRGCRAGCYTRIQSIVGAKTTRHEARSLTLWTKYSITKKISGHLKTIKTRRDDCCGPMSIYLSTRSQICTARETVHLIAKLFRPDPDIFRLHVFPVNIQLPMQTQRCTLKDKVH
jgi:hypothetical protein